MREFKNDNSSGIDAAHTRLTPRGPSAGRRLVREGLITQEEYDRIYTAERNAWNDILAMDEAALDAELGKDEAAWINASAGCSPLDDHVPARSPAPALRVVGAKARALAPAPYDCHYRLRLAGLRDGLMLASADVEEELRSVRKLLMATEECFAPDAFMNLRDYLVDGRLLLVERVRGGQATLEGCVVYEHKDVVCPDGKSGGLVRQRVNLIRLLAAKESEHRAMLAGRLSLEAMLRGTVRALHRRDGLACIGTLGVVAEMNGRALAWAERLGHRVRILDPNVPGTKSDRTLTAFHDQFAGRRVGAARRIPYRFVIADRMQLLEAAQLHVIGVVPYKLREDEAGLRIDYDIDDPCSPQILKAAKDLVGRAPGATARFGLAGRGRETVWGPQPSSDMTVPVPPRPDHIRSAVPNSAAA